jgi:Predicted nucleic-acid-binding protein implicated in transcription termination
MAPNRMLRFAVDMAGAVIPDPEHRMPGRGLWLAPGPGAVETARAKGVFARGAKRKVQVAPDLAARALEAWTAHAAAQVAKARRAGLVLHGNGAAGAETLAVTGPENERLLLRQAPFSRRVAADLALLAALRSGEG